MLNERNAAGVARYIKLESQNNYEEGGFVEIEGIRVTHPYLHIYMPAAYESMDQEMLDSYDQMVASVDAMYELFEQQEIPNSWKDFFKEVDEIRKRNGCETPIDIVSGIMFFALEKKDLASELDIKPFKILPSGWPDLSDKDKVRRQIDVVINHPKARTSLEELLAYQTPDMSGNSASVEVLKSLVELRKLEHGVAVDLGCGTGDRTSDLAKQIDMRFIGVERQFHPDYYKLWVDPESPVTFIRTDARELGIVDGSADLILIENVSQHTTTEALSNIIREASRILKPEGILAISPQEYEYKGRDRKNDGSWRFFEKMTNSRGETVLRRRTLEQLSK